MSGQAKHTPNPKAMVVAVAAWLLVRLLGLSWRLRLDDPLGIARPDAPPGPKIWVFWHNRIAGMPLIYLRWFRHRRAVVLTSPSSDGEILARTMRLFHLGAVRGSSSRRGARALAELVATLRAGGDVIITPDGPRGPKYQLQPGLIQLSALTGAPIVPIVVSYSRHYTFRSWDAFRLPRPGALVTATLLEPIVVPPQLDDPAFEEMRLLVQSRLRDASCEVIEGA